MAKGHAPEHVAYLQRYTRDLASRLGLSDWEITVSAEFSGDTAEASTWLPHAQPRATIRLGDCFTSHTPKYQREIVVHELLHIHLNPVNRVFELLEGQLPPPMYAYVRAMYDERQDFALDSLAPHIAQFMPELRLPVLETEEGEEML